MAEKHKKTDDDVPSSLVWIIAVAAVLILFNQIQLYHQIQLYQLNTMIGQPALPGLSFGTSAGTTSTLGGKDLKNVDVSTLKSTAQAVGATMDLADVKDAQSVINKMIPSGIPTYAKDLGISYDDPVAALQFLAYKLYPAIKADVKQNDPKTWQRYLNLATKPVGISCEFCCGVGPVGITKDGELTCGCSHNPAIQAITLYLMKNTQMNDAEVLREALRWKSLWFPKNMVDIGVKIVGGDPNVLNDVPSMVGGC